MLQIAARGGLWLSFGQGFDRAHAQFQGDRTMETRAATWLTVDDDRHVVARDGRWLSIRQIASDLGVSSSTAYKWSARGAPWFPRTIRLHNGDIRVRRDWYETWLGQLEQ
jgi:predicted DNA-binding transcriptional regulator AlpA